MATAHEEISRSSGNCLCTYIATIKSIDRVAKTASISSNEKGDETGVPFFYHCPNETETADGHRGFAIGQKVIILNISDAEKHIIAHASSYREVCEYDVFLRFRIHLRFSSAFNCSYTYSPSPYYYIGVKSGSGTMRFFTDDEVVEGGLLGEPTEDMLKRFYYEVSFFNYPCQSTERYPIYYREAITPHIYDSDICGSSPNCIAGGWWSQRDNYGYGYPFSDTPRFHSATDDSVVAYGTFTKTSRYGRSMTDMFGVTSYPDPIVLLNGEYARNRDFVSFLDFKIEKTTTIANPVSIGLCFHVPAWKHYIHRPDNGFKVSVASGSTDVTEMSVNTELGEQITAAINSHYDSIIPTDGHIMYFSAGRKMLIGL